MTEPYPDMILLDWMLPGTSGVQIAKTRLKIAIILAHIPIIMLTARGEEEDKVKGLEVGADDYVQKDLTKPFSVAKRIDGTNKSCLFRRVSPTSLRRSH